MKLFFLTLSLVATAYCIERETDSQEYVQTEELEMHHTIENQKKKFFSEFPQGLIAAWQAIWQANLSRSYTTDFELYSSDFDPQRNPEVKVCIAIKKDQ